MEQMKQSLEELKVENVPRLRIIFSCGCGNLNLVAEDYRSIEAKAREAEIHSQAFGHTLQIRGEIRFSKDSRSFPFRYSPRDMRNMEENRHRRPFVPSPRRRPY